VYDGEERKNGRCVKESILDICEENRFEGQCMYELVLYEEGRRQHLARKWTYCTSYHFIVQLIQYKKPDTEKPSSVRQNA
jgi:hypothetical protein